MPYAVDAVRPRYDDAVLRFKGVSETPVSPIAVTIGHPENKLTGGTRFKARPPRVTQWGVVEANDGTRLDVNDMTNFGVRPPGYLDGARLDVYRIVNGEMVHVGHATVASMGYVAFTRLPKVYSASPIRWSPADYHRPSHTNYYWVAALDSNGDRSDWAGPVTWATGASHTNNTNYVNSTRSDLEYTNVHNAGIAAPTGLSVASENNGESFAVTFNEPAGAEGYVLALTDVNAAPVNDGVGMTLQGNSGELVASDIQVGDMIIQTKSFDHTTTREQVAFSRVWTASDGVGAFGPGLGHKFADESAVSFEWIDEGDEEAFLRVTNNGESDQELSRYCHSGSANAYYSTLEIGVTYNQTIRARSPNGSGVELVMPWTNPATVAIALGSDWGEHTSAHLAETADTSIVAHKSSITIPAGGVVDISRWWAYDSRFEPLGWRPEDIAQLSGVSYIRPHSLTKTYPDQYDLAELTDPDGLPAILNLLKSAGVNPWLQIDPALTPEEWHGLVEYLCAEHVSKVATPWAWKRVQQGQPAPWISEFTSILLEPSNEPWNSLTEFWQAFGVSGHTSGESWALYVDWLIGHLRSAPHWTAEADRKFGWDGTRMQNAVLGGWAEKEDVGWNLALAKTNTKAGWLMRANYNGGWDNGEDSLPVWENILGKMSRAELTVRSQAITALCAANGLKHGIYEAGPGYVKSGLNGASLSGADEELQHRMMKSIGGGTATLASFCIAGANGTLLQNFFNYGNEKGGWFWYSHAPWIEGGQPNASWLWMRFWIEHFAGGQLSEPLPVQARMMTLPTGDVVPVIRAWRVRNGRKVYIIVTNHDVTQANSVSIPMKGLKGKACTRHWLEAPYAVPGEEFKAHNVYAANAGDVVMSSEPFVFSLPFQATVGAGLCAVYEFT